MMNSYNFDIALDLNECDIRVYLRDSTDLLSKALTYKRKYQNLCIFLEYGYPQEWKRIIINLWRYWNVKTFKQFAIEMDKLTSKDRTAMLEEIAFSEVVNILKSRNYEI